MPNPVEENLMPRWNGTPPPAERVAPSYHVLRVQRDGPLDVTLLSDTVRCVVTHWLWDAVTQRGKSVACVTHEADCRHHEKRIEWTGWLPVYSHDLRKRCVLRLAPKEADSLGAVLGVDVDWRHLRVLLTPMNQGDGKRCAVERRSEHFPPATLGAFSVDPTICAVLGCDHVPLQGPPPPEEGEEWVPLPEGGAR